MIKTWKNFVKEKAFLLISGLIVLFIIAQTSESLQILCPRSCAPFFWPFMDYPMYSVPHYVDDRINQYQVIGTLDDLNEVEIDYEDLNLDLPFKMGIFYRAILENNEKNLAIYVDAYQHKYGKRLIGLRLENQPLVFLGNGVEPAPKKVVADVSLPQPEEKR